MALLNSTQFWLVKPRLSLAEDFRAGYRVEGKPYRCTRISDWDDKPARRFKALAEPPPLSEDAARVAFDPGF